MNISESDRQIVVGALDSLGVALADHDHEWTVGERTALFDLVFQRADRKDGRVVGVRHFTKSGCQCKICAARGR